MAVTPDAHATWDSVSGTSASSVSFTVGAGANYLLAAFESPRNPVPGSVQWNGVAMSLLGSIQNAVAGTGRSIYLYGLANPTTGTHTLTATNSPAYAHGWDISSWNGVDTSITPTIVSAQAATGTTGSLTRSGSLFVHYLGVRQTGGSISKTGGAMTDVNATWHTEGSSSNQQWYSAYCTSGTSSWSWSTSDYNVQMGVALTASASLPPGTAVKAKKPGVGSMVDGILRVRQAASSTGGWITPLSVAPYFSGLTARSNLPWNLPAFSPASKYVMGHYFTQFPRRINNVVNGPTEYYQKNWIKPGAVEGTTDHRVYGGFTRDRTPDRAVLPGVWQQTDMYQEITDAVAAGIDGFFVDLLSLTTTSNHWKNLNFLFDACDAWNTANPTDPFYLVPMPDGTAGPCNSTFQSGSTTLIDINASAIVLADAIAGFLSRACIWKPGGVFTLPIFGPELFKSGVTNPQSDRVTYWNAVKNRLQTTYSTPTRLWMCYVQTWTSAPCAPALNAIAYGHSRWGDRDAVATGANNDYNRNAPAKCHTTYGKPWMHFGAPGDSRPSDHYLTGYRYWEQAGSLTFHNTWSAAIDGGAEAIQMTTWNDYSEHAHIAPSINHEHVWNDLNTYYVTKFKTGAFPTIQQDGLYLFHRVHPTTLSSFTGTQTRFAILQGSTAAKDIVEVRAFLTAPATIEMLVNGTVTQSVSGVAGDNRFEFPLPTSGVVSAQATRSSTLVPGTLVTSTVTLGGSQVADDRHYRAFSSLRQYTNT